MPKSIDQYSNERKDILQKMLVILDLSENNKMISLQTLDNDLEKQQKIMDLIPDIKKYFVCSRWTYFCNKNQEIKRNYLSIIKAVARDMNVKITSSTIVKKENNKNKRETHYIFEI